MDDPEALLDLLPQAAREAFARALAVTSTTSGEAQKHTGDALAAVGIPQTTPDRGVFPLASSYNAVQRAALEYSCAHKLGTWPYPCPSPFGTRRRWLGLDPGGELETRTILVEHDGVATHEPLWRALQISREVMAQAAMLDAMPCEVTLRVLGELYRNGIGYRINDSLLLPHGNLRVLRDLRDEGRAWAIEQADSMTSDGGGSGSHLRAFVFLALVRAGVSIAPRWDHLYPNVFGATPELLFECARALPALRRDAILGPHLRAMSCSIEMIAEFPSAALVRALLDGSEANSERWTWLVERLRALGQSQPVVRNEVEAIVAATPKPMKLYVSQSSKPADVNALTELQKRQIRIAGQGYDDQDLPAEERMAADSSESSFLGFIELRTVADARGTPLYDVLLYMVDSGSIFAAGTTEEIGGVAQGGVVLREKNDALRHALQIAIGAKPLRLKAPRAKPASKTATKRKPAGRK